MRHVFKTMGTVASIDLESAALPHLDRIEEIFRDADERFSLYRPQSELSRIARRDLALIDASDTLRSAYARALDWRAATGGLFTPHRPDGVIDLNGTVKAEAIESAGAVLDAAGCRGWTINVGGDILTRASPDHRLAPVGIADPHHPEALLCSIALDFPRRAIATSGSAQRGDHIWLGGRIQPAEFRQVTVLADDIGIADVLATSIVAAGSAGIDALTDRWDIDVLTVDRGGELTATPEFRAAIESSRCSGALSDS